ncbi:MAG: YjdF family protein [Clostridiales bacterium]|nr:YjdF family protein [Clostridiales bacterium]
METTASKLTVLFEDPFWIGVYERESGGLYEACKITFGAEPKDYEVYDFMLKHWNRLRFSPPIAAEMTTDKPINPKRQQRLIKKQMQNTGTGTKAQQALQLQRETGKLQQKSVARTRRDAEKEQRFALHQQKRKEKHRGH